MAHTHTHVCEHGMSHAAVRAHFTCSRWQEHAAVLWQTGAMRAAVRWQSYVVHAGVQVADRCGAMPFEL